WCRASARAARAVPCGAGRRARRTPGPRRRTAGQSAVAAASDGTCRTSVTRWPRASCRSPPLLGAGPQPRHLVLPAACIALPLTFAQRLRQVECRESALNDGHADLVTDRPDVELDQG